MLDFGAALPSADYGIAVLHTNAKGAHFAHGDVASPTTDTSFVSETNHAPLRDMLTGRYKSFAIKTLGGASKRYLRYRLPGVTPFDAAAYLSSGAVVVCSELVTMERSPNVTIPTDIEQEMYGERTPRTGKWLEMEWRFPGLFGLALDQVQQLLLLDEGALFLAYLGRGDTQEVYILRRIGKPRYELDARKRSVITFRVKEHIGVNAF